MEKFFLRFKLPSLATIFFLALILRLVISVLFHSADSQNHVIWGKSLVEDGLADFYQRGFVNIPPATYGPLGILPLGIFYLLSIFLVNFTWFLNTSIPPFPSNLVYFFSFENYNLVASIMKLSGIFGDLIVAGFIYLFAVNILKSKNPKIFPVLYLFNPAIFYLSSVWGQFESLVLAFSLGAFYFVLRKKSIAASIFFALGLLTKQTAIFFAPIWAILFLKTFGLKKTFFSSVAIFLIFYLVHLPFELLNPQEIFNLYSRNLAQITDRVYENAFNFWYFIFAPLKPTIFETFARIPYQFWGWLVFSIFAIPALISLYKKPNPKFTILITYYLLLTTFLFLTRINDRFLAFVLPFSLLAIPINFTSFLGIYLSISTIHFLNLYKNLLWPNVLFFSFLVENLLIVKLMIILLLGIFVYISFQVWRIFKLKS